MVISQCVCERVTFKKILAWAEQHQVSSIEEIKLTMGCGRQCGLCEKFIRYALATGTTEVPYPCPPLPASSIR